MGQVVEHLQRLLDDVVGPLALNIYDEADSARVVLIRWIVETLCLRNAVVVVHHDPRLDSGSADFAEPWRLRLPLDASCASPLACTEMRPRSVCVESTTIVSVRDTPSIERIVLINRSSDEVLSV